MIKIICLSLLFNITASLASEKPECPTTQILSCEKHTAQGLTYTAPPMNLANDCEHGWYYPNGTCIGFSTGGTTPNLSLNTCENLQLQIHCPTPVFNCNINFTVLDVKTFTTMQPQANNTVGLSALKIVLIVIVFVVALSIII